MKITILGTGTFYVDKFRSAQAYLLEVNNKKILIDCGPGTLIRLSEVEIKPEEIDYIFITHFHADHTADLFSLQMGLRLNEFFGDGKECKTPIIFGPEGMKEFTKKLSYVYELPAFDNYSKIEYREYGNLIDLDKIKIKPFKVDHTAFGKKAKAYALRFEIDKNILVFSGDSINCEGLSNASKNADLFICDASYAKNKASPAHLDTYDIGEIVQNSKVKKVVLSHFYPNTKDIDLVGEVKEKYDGEVVMGSDFMELII
jgi:ribonuclease BN (tRNA processing enzyme)